MSAITAETSALPVASHSSAVTRSVFVGLRPTTTTVARSRASCSAAARPSPEVAPVTTITRPVRS